MTNDGYFSNILAVFGRTVIEWSWSDCATQVSWVINVQQGFFSMPIINCVKVSINWWSVRFSHISGSVCTVHDAQKFSQTWSETTAISMNKFILFPVTVGNYQYYHRLILWYFILMSNSRSPIAATGNRTRTCTIRSHSSKMFTLAKILLIVANGLQLATRFLVGSDLVGSRFFVLLPSR